VLYAPLESKLRIVEIFFDVLVFVLTISHILSMNEDQLQDMPFLNLWLIIDTVIMFLTLPYTFFSQFVMVEGEITKNLFTLYQVQRSKLILRRNNATPNTPEWKNFFVEPTIDFDREPPLSRKPQLILKGKIPEI
jgi:hypothetical protein